MLAPTYLQKIGHELAIRWNNGSETYLSLEKLRRECPCAICQEGPRRTDRLTIHSSQDIEEETINLPILSSTSFELTGWELVGGYGFQPKWGDGHSSGIFTWEYLKACSP